MNAKIKTERVMKTGKKKKYKHGKAQNSGDCFYELYRYILMITCVLYICTILFLLLL